MLFFFGGWNRFGVDWGFECEFSGSVGFESEFYVNDDFVCRFFGLEIEMFVCV